MTKEKGLLQDLLLGKLHLEMQPNAMRHILAKYGISESILEEGSPDMAAAGDTLTKLGSFLDDLEEKGTERGHIVVAIASLYTRILRNWVREQKLPNGQSLAKFEGNLTVAMEGDFGDLFKGLREQEVEDPMKKAWGTGSTMIN